MQLKAKSLEELKTIIQRDYGVDLANEDANLLGNSLLKLSRLAVTAVDKAEERRSLGGDINKTNLVTGGGVGVKGVAAALQPTTENGSYNETNRN